MAMSSMITKDIFQELNQVSKEGKENSVKREINLIIKKVLQVKDNGLIKLCLTDGKYESSEFIIKANKDSIPNENEIIQCGEITIKKNHYKTVYVIKKYKIIKPELESKDELMMLFDETESQTKQNVKKNEYEDEDTAQTYEYKPPMKANYGKYDDSQCILVSQITSFTQNATLYIKCTTICDTREFNSAKGPSKLKNYIFTDTEGSEIQAVCFGESVDKMEKILQLNFTYELIRPWIRMKDNRFSKCPGEYEIVLNDRTVIRPVPDNRKFQQAKYKFTDIKEIGDLSKGKTVDIYGVVLDSQTASIETKSGTRDIRRLKVADRSMFAVEVTLWPPFNEEKFEVGNIFVGHILTVNEYNGKKTLGSIASTKVLRKYNQDTDRVLLRFFKEHSEDEFSFVEGTLSLNKEPVELNFVKNIKEDTDEFPKTRKIVGHILRFKPDVRNYYMGCEKCKKKLVVEEDKYKCEKCGICERPKVYLVLSFLFRDCSGDLWCEMFGEPCTWLIGYTAEEYKTFLEENNVEKITEVEEKINYRNVVLVGRLRKQAYNNTIKERFSVYKLNDIDKNECLGIVRGLEGLKSVAGI